MKRTILILVAAMMVVGMSTPVLAEDALYIGAAKCFTCHKKDKSGNQMQKWLDSGHSKAYETLASDASKAIAAEMGIEDPQKAEQCLKCHVTAAGAPAEAFDPKGKYALEDGVGCESCHGAGSTYKSMKVMKAITSGDTDGASVGLVTPTAETCTVCHNEESPTFKAFNFEEAFKKIDHSIPEEHMAKYK